jgi:hypothetical protein
MPQVSSTARSASLASQRASSAPARLIRLPSFAHQLRAKPPLRLAVAALARLEHHDVQAGLGLLQAERRPQPDETAADHGHVGMGLPPQAWRLGRSWPLVTPEDSHAAETTPRKSTDSAHSRNNRGHAREKHNTNAY